MFCAALLEWFHMHFLFQLSKYKAGGDPKHFFDALAMSERDDRKDSFIQVLKSLINLAGNKDAIRWRPSLLGWRPLLLVTRNY